MIFHDISLASIKVNIRGDEGKPYYPSSTNEASCDDFQCMLGNYIQQENDGNCIEQQIVDDSEAEELAVSFIGGKERVTDEDVYSEIHITTDESKKVTKDLKREVDASEEDGSCFQGMLINEHPLFIEERTLTIEDAVEAVSQVPSIESVTYIITPNEPLPPVEVGLTDVGLIVEQVRDVDIQEFPITSLEDSEATETISLNRVDNKSDLNFALKESSTKVETLINEPLLSTEPEDSSELFPRHMSIISKEEIPINIITHEEDFEPILTSDFELNMEEPPQKQEALNSVEITPSVIKTEENKSSVYDIDLHDKDSSAFTHNPWANETQGVLQNETSQRHLYLDDSFSESQLFDEMVSEARAYMARGQRVLRLKLHPEHLGEVEMRISAKGKEISATIIAETPEVKELLEGGLFRLREAFLQEELILSNISVRDGSEFGMGGNAPSGYRWSNPSFTTRKGTLYKRGSKGEKGSLEIIKGLRRPDGLGEGVLNVFI